MTGFRILRAVRGLTAKSHLVSTVAGVLAAIYVLLALSVYPEYTIDDAFITFRYAENLADHGELTWNVGEEPVEGYTGVLAPVAISLVIFLGGDPIAASDVVGVLAFLAGGVILLYCCRRAGYNNTVTAALIVLYATNPMMYTHLFSGLETVWFSTGILLVVLLLRECADDPSGGGRKQALFLLSLVAVSLVRPEGFALAGLAWSGLLIYYLLFRRRLVGTFVLRSLILFVLPLAAYLFWKLQYYDSLLPNTYYAKGFHGAQDVERTYSSLRGFWHQYLALPVYASAIMCIGLILTRRRAVRSIRYIPDRKADILVIIIAVAFLALVIAKYHRSMLTMNFSYRFWIHYYPLFFLMLAGIISMVLDRLAIARLSRWMVRVGLGLMFVFLISQTYRHVNYLGKEMRNSRAYHQLIEHEHRPIGQYLNAVIAEDEWIISYVDAGAVPYYSKRRAVDFGGLNDLTLARDSLSSEEKVDYFFSIDAAAVVITSLAKDSLTYDTLAGLIAADPRFSLYRLVRIHDCDECLAYHRYHEFVYLRSDIAENLGLPTIELTVSNAAKRESYTVTLRGRGA